MFRRRTAAKIALRASLLLLVACRIAYQQTQPAKSTGRHLCLVEGEYRVQRIVDPITFVVEPLEKAARHSSPALTVRLASLDVKPRPAGSVSQRDFQLPQLIGNGAIHLRFDRQRFDTDQTPIAYAFAGERLVNADLVACQAAVPKFVPGNSAKLQRQIFAAQAGGGLASP